MARFASVTCRPRTGRSFTFGAVVEPPGEDLPPFVSWVHLLPAALGIIMWLDAKTDTAESEYLIASQARKLTDRLTRDLEAAGVDIRHPQPAHGAAYLRVFAETSSALLARLRAAQ